jgi:hypothetical protein
VVSYHGLARRYLTALGFMMRSLLNGGTLGRRMRSIDPDDVYQRALTGQGGVDALDDAERLVYALKELETYIAMQGWGCFFTGSCSYLYPDVLRCLELSGDSRSLAILNDYVAYLLSVGVLFDADAIEAWERTEASDAPSVPDWGKQFQAAAADRWRNLRHYFSSQDIRLTDSAGHPSISGRVDSFAADLAALIGSSAPKTWRDG